MVMFHVVLREKVLTNKKVLKKKDFLGDHLHSRPGNSLNVNDIGGKLTNVFSLYLMPVLYHKTGKEL